MKFTDARNNSSTQAAAPGLSNSAVTASTRLSAYTMRATSWKSAGPPSEGGKSWPRRMDASNRLYAFIDCTHSRDQTKGREHQQPVPSSLQLQGRPAAGKAAKTHLAIWARKSSQDQVPQVLCGQAEAQVRPLPCKAEHCPLHSACIAGGWLNWGSSKVCFFERKEGAGSQPLLASRFSGWTWGSAAK